METQEFTQAEDLYQPTAEQAQRDAKLRRFNLLYVYTPIGLVSALAISIVVILLIVAVNPPSEETLIFLSGLADVALVIAMLPVIVVGAVLLGLIIYSFVQARRSGAAPVRQTQKLLWRMNNVVDRLQVRTAHVADAIVQPFMTLNGAFSYVKVLLGQILGMVKRR